MCARQHKIAEVACNRTERTLIGCRVFRYGICGSPSDQGPRANTNTKWVGQALDRVVAYFW